MFYIDILCNRYFKLNFEKCIFTNQEYEYACILSQPVQGNGIFAQSKKRNKITRVFSTEQKNTGYRFRQITSELRVSASRIIRVHCVGGV